MAGIIEKMSSSTDLIGLDVGATSQVPEGFDACLASQTTLVEGSAEAKVPAELEASINRQSLTTPNSKLSKSLTHTSSDERSDSSVATSDAALLIKSLGAMIEPEAKPVPVGLEALGKVIALRTGQSVSKQEPGAALVAAGVVAVESAKTGPANPLVTDLQTDVSTAQNQTSIGQSLTKKVDTKDGVLTAPLAGSKPLKAHSTTIQSALSAVETKASLAGDSLNKVIDSKLGSQASPPAETQLKSAQSASTVPTSSATTTPVPTMTVSEVLPKGSPALASEASASRVLGSGAGSAEVEAALGALQEIPSAKTGVGGQPSEAAQVKSVSSAGTMPMRPEQVKTSPMTKVTKADVPVEAAVAASRVVDPKSVNTQSGPVSDSSTTPQAVPLMGNGADSTSTSEGEAQPSLRVVTENSIEAKAETVPSSTESGASRPTAAVNSETNTKPMNNGSARTSAESNTLSDTPSGPVNQASVGKPAVMGGGKTQSESPAQPQTRLNAGASDTPVSADSGTTLKGAEQSTRLRSRLGANTRSESARRPERMVGAQEVVSQASKLVRPTKVESRTNERRATARPSLGASERVKVLGQALRAEVVDVEVSKGPRELSVARNAMRLRERSNSASNVTKSPLMSRRPMAAMPQALSQNDTAITGGLGSATLSNSTAPVSATLPSAEGASGPFKLRFAENSTASSSSPVDTNSAETRVASEAVRTGQVKSALTDAKVSATPAEATSQRGINDVDADGRPALNQDGQQNSGGRQDGQNQRPTQAAPAAKMVAEQPTSTDSSFAESMEAANSTSEEVDEAVMRSRADTRSTTTAGRNVERSFGGRTTQTSNQAQVQATMRQDLLHKLSAAEFPGHVSNLLFRNQEQARLQLHPAELGRMNLELQVKAGEVQMKVAVESAAAAAEIQGQLGQLKEQLQNQGLRLGDVSVDVSHKEFEADGQSMGESGERGRESGREDDSRRAEDEQDKVNKNKKRKKSADGRLDVIA